MVATSKSGRVVKRTRRLISQSKDDKAPVQKKKAQTMDQQVPVKSIDDQNVSSQSIEEVQPAKKMKLSTSALSKAVNVPIIETSKTKYVDIFPNSIQMAIQSDTVRHSRLFEMAHELQQSNTTDVDCQYRAVENLITYKAELQRKHNEMMATRSSKMAELMHKFRGIKNRQQICNDFASKFTATTSEQWKPFAQDAQRLSNHSEYKVVQVIRRPIITVLCDEFVKQNYSKETSRPILIQMLKLLPNRPEVRHEFINVYLPKVLAENRRAGKKATKNVIKRIIDTNPKFQCYF